MPAWPDFWAARLAEVEVAEEEFLLYPLDTGEDPVCVSCGKAMLLAAQEARHEGRAS
jgi:hypothetical protein